MRSTVKVLRVKEKGGIWEGEEKREMKRKRERRKEKGREGGEKGGKMSKLRKRSQHTCMTVKEKREGRRGKAKRRGNGMNRRGRQDE